MCIDQSNAKHAMVSWSLVLVLVLVLGIFIPTTSYFVLSCAPTPHAFNMVVQLSFTSSSSLSYLYLSVFVYYYGLHRFLNNMIFFKT
ncbi:hypothetical protein B296_00054192 [Ensete ventricosum]|uniref:Uncharacterized protein n=1 Tax=Ensete ventricosum TaxID=4639 RepID=A0A426XHW5_ENSVE|nr:hypothetical protein B296_00054192 [Ensete ventricosum]